MHFSGKYFVLSESLRKVARRIRLKKYSILVSVLAVACSTRAPIWTWMKTMPARKRERESTQKNIASQRNEWCQIKCELNLTKRLREATKQNQNKTTSPICAATIVVVVVAAVRLAPIYSGLCPRSIAQEVVPRLSRLNDRARTVCWLLFDTGRH